MALSDQELGSLLKDVQHIKDSVDELKETMREDCAKRETTDRLQGEIDKCVTADQFLPVKLIAYGFAGIILTAVMLALIGLLFVKGKGAI